MITGLFLQWLWIDAPRTYSNYSKQVTLALFNYFSIPLLASTLFAPWRHDAVDVSRLPLTYWFQALNQNLVSRLVGFVVRSFTIGTGFFVLFILNLGFLLFLVAWYVLPILLVVSFVYGFRLIFGGLHV